MFNLLPVELWEYNPHDIIRGLAAGLDSRKQIETIHMPGLGACIPVRSARAAIVAAIRALELPASSRVGVPLYCCPVVFKSVLAADCVPIFIDIDPSNFCMSAEGLFEKRSQVDAVIAVHMFGNMCDIPGLQEAVKGRPVIEDCAQAIGSKLAGRMAGSIGDISVFSFRSGKQLSVGEGGAIFTADAEVWSRLSRIIGVMPVPRRTDECRHVAMTFLRSMLRSKPFYGAVGYPLWSAYNKSVGFTSQSPLIISQIFRADLANIANRLAILSSMISKNRANADFYSRTLKLDPEMLTSEKSGEFRNRYQYPVTFPSRKHRDLVASYLRRHGIDTSKPLDEIIGVSAKYFGYLGDCPVAEDLSKRVLIIPSHHKLRQRNLEDIAQRLNSGWAEISNHSAGLLYG